MLSFFMATNDFSLTWIKGVNLTFERLLTSYLGVNKKSPV